MILFAAGDVGGAQALLPIIQECDGRRVSFFVLEHGCLSAQCPTSWPKALPPKDLDPATVSAWLADRKISALVFGSSVHDTMPLTLARHAQEHGLAVVHVLDNWSSYRRRLEHDGLPLLIPDIYTVMDELAYEAAVVEGVAAECIRITGQPALASLAAEAAMFAKGEKEEGALHLIFVSEPVEADQGGGLESPQFRGYTEKTVLTLLCQALQPYSGQIRLSVLPHPREDRHGLEDSWQAAKGGLRGAILAGGDGRRQVMAADGVVGMASILLYEAWLLGKPVLSLQPGLRTNALRVLAQRAGVCFIDAICQLDAVLDAWVQSLRQGNSAPRSDLLRHRGAAAQVCDLLNDLMGRPDIGKQ